MKNAIAPQLNLRAEASKAHLDLELSKSYNALLGGRDSRISELEAQVAQLEELTVTSEEQWTHEQHKDVIARTLMFKEATQNSIPTTIQYTEIDERAPPPPKYELIITSSSSAVAYYLLLMASLSTTDP
ncbi:hypothetical protein H0H87_007276 [Tephrocybe sp. NHM501043]|nr:hypothetical protein H0H87_007276 [Tephrocybe sp. NHM501043]